MKWKEYDNFIFSNVDIVKTCGFVTTLDSEPIGHITWNPMHKPDYIEIGHNCIVTNYKGLGYGHLQLAEAISRIKKYNAKKVIVSTNITTIPAQRNYLSVGFVEVKRVIKNDYTGGIIYYELNLENSK